MKKKAEEDILGNHRGFNYLRLMVLLFVLLPALVAHEADAADDIHEKKFSQGYSKMLSNAKRNGRIIVIVGVDLDYLESNRVTPEQWEEYRARIAYKQRQLLNEMALKDVEVDSLLSSIPFVILNVNATELEALKSIPIAISVEESIELGIPENY